jgi:transcriptional regulator GlxA family with amidase domain
MTRNVGIFIFDEIEVLDFAGPFEVFSVASRVRRKQDAQAVPPFNVFTVGRGLEPIKTRGALSVTPHFSFKNHPLIDLLVIPGGVVTAELAKAEVIQWIRQTSSQAKTVAGICTGAFLLAQAGLLDGQRVTTHWEDIADLKAMFPLLHVEENVRWVQQGRVFTSAGISAGIDLSLHLITQLEGEKLAVDTARQMDYRWTPGV